MCNMEWDILRHMKYCWVVVCQFECDALAHWIIGNTLYSPSDKLAKEWWEAFQELEKRRRPYGNLRRPLNVVFTAYELEPASIFSSIFLFWFWTLLMKKYYEGFQNSKIVNYFH